jgi:NTP pyrophosphatase (non-canonical NTP hydrolase)
MTYEAYEETPEWGPAFVTFRMAKPKDKRMSHVPVSQEFSEPEVEDNLLEYFEQSVDEGCVHRDDTYPFLGLSGETGEVLELVKKSWRKEGPQWADVVDVDKLRDELGDVLWYVTRCLHVLDVSLADAMVLNMRKLEKRKQIKEALNGN